MAESGSSVTWGKAHDCVDALQELVRIVDRDCTRAEENKDLSADAIRRRRAELCDQALGKLANFRSFEVAETALSREIDALDRVTTPDAQQAQLHQTMTKALADLREGIDATRRMVLERCKLRERAAV